MDTDRNFSFELPTKIVFGAGEVRRRLADELSRIGATRALIVSDEGIEKSGLLERITPLMKEAGMPFEVFTRVSPNPRGENVREGAALCREKGCDAIVAVGGGSPIDCAKGIAVLATHDGTLDDYRGVENIPGEPLPIIAIPTTAGTGSEVTFSSVLTDPAAKVKFTLRSVKIAAKTAICDPELTLTMPPGLTAATGMDAMTHAIEGFTAKCATPIANAAALHAIELISNSLRAAVADGSNISARADMLMGSVLAAISFSHSDVAAVHCIAESLGGMYDLPHGACNAVCLPEVMEYSADACVDKYARVARAMDLDFTSPEAGAKAAVDEIRKISRDIGLPSFSSFGIAPTDFREIAEKSVANLSNASNPRVLDADDYVAILEKLNRG